MGFNASKHIAPGTFPLWNRSTVARAAVKIPLPGRIYIQQPSALKTGKGLKKEMKNPSL